MNSLLKNGIKITTGSIVPRPIAWVSTVDKKGRPNLAPFSYFNAVCTDPLTLMFCPGVYPSGRKKDTWLNIEEVPAFVVNMTNEATAEAMNRSATGLPRGDSEFDWAGVTPVPSETIAVPRVAEAPVAFECVLDRIVVISDSPTGGGAAIFGRVQRIHIDDAIYQNGYVLFDKYQPIGRLAGASYTRVNDLFNLRRLPYEPDV